nr:MAG TPA: hypothetical protein [Caudoviricetes sp.]DAW62428.1 MAG TPA: hypothetical protein [Caudoviricetes sp.]
MRIHVDASACTYLPMCECGWRGLPAASHERALTQVSEHERHAHPGDRHARRALSAYRWRHV